MVGQHGHVERIGDDVVWLATNPLQHAGEAVLRRGVGPHQGGLIEHQADRDQAG